MALRHSCVQTGSSAGDSVASLLVLAPTRGLGGGVKGLLSSMSFKQPFLSLLASHSFSHPKEINQSLGKCC